MTTDDVTSGGGSGAARPHRRNIDPLNVEKTSRHIRIRIDAKTPSSMPRAVALGSMLRVSYGVIL